MRFLDRPLLAIESSCDETSASVVLGRKVLSNVVASQSELHLRWGGVVPEAAARAHVEALVPVLAEATACLDGAVPAAVAVTTRPGLVGSLSVGVSAAKALALAWQVPLIGIHHLEGHLMSVWEGDAWTQESHLSLIVSGGHTELVQVDGLGLYHILGETLDDAAGEAFDKGARLLGLGSPGGLAIQEMAARGDPKRYHLPRGLCKDPYNFSFSGLKTAMLRLVQNEGSLINKPDAAASLQEAIVDSLCAKSMHALDASGARAFTLVGGVSANKLLRARIGEECSRRGVAMHSPRLDMCTDNAAMIGLAASARLAAGERAGGWDLDAEAVAPLPGPPAP